MRLNISRVVVAACLLFATPVLADNPENLKLFETDAAGTADHPWTGRYDGSHILLQSVSAYAQLKLPSGAALEPSYSDKKHFSKLLEVEGRVTRTVYVTPAGRSALEVFRNFQNHLTEAGWTIAWQCENAACGESFKNLKYNWQDKATHVRGANMDTGRARFVESVFDGAQDIHYALMQKGSGPGASYVGLYVTDNSGGGFGDMSHSLEGRVTALVEVLEPKAMESRIVILKAEAIGNELRADGSVSLYGLQFDTDKADLKPESKPQLDEMVRYMKANPAAKVYIVGHTDNQGPLDHNQALSDRRAKAVVAFLTGQGVAANRMVGRGVGPLSPKASNADDAGRTKNRRVEMVLQ